MRRFGNIVCGATFGVVSSQSRFTSQDKRGGSDSAAEDGATSRAWYVRMWKLVQDGSSAPVSGATSAPMSFAEIRVAMNSHGERDMLPDGIVDGLWQVYRMIPSNDWRTQVQFFGQLSEVGTDVEGVKLQLGEAHRVAENLDNDPQATKKIRTLLTRATQAATPMYARWLVESAARGDGIRWLIDMRADVLDLEQSIAKEMKTQEKRGDATGSSSLDSLKHQRSVLKSFEIELTRLLREWFARTWLVCDQLSWDRTPATILEQVLIHEAVHPFGSLVDVKDRVQPTNNRHTFAFFHPSVVNAPLVMVQVALTNGIARSVDHILGRESPLEAPEAGKPDTAMFYSITSVQRGLKGIDLGNSLIKAVVGELRSGVAPEIQKYCTLSPIPGYVSWLKVRCQQLAAGASAASPLRVFSKNSAVETRCLEAVAKCLAVDATPSAVSAALLALAGDGTSPSSCEWVFNQKLTDALREPLLRSVAFYLCEEKRRGRILDPVGNFHVGNGAIVHQLNYLGNVSPRGVGQSLGIMVNYLYDLPTVVENSAAYVATHKVAVSPAISELVE